MTQKERKQKHFDKKYREAPWIECGCGCGTKIKSVDKYARPKRFENGHNNRKYEDPKQHKREWNKRNKPQKTLYRKNKRQERKGLLILYKGGECSDCGLKYDGKNGCKFDFHHIEEKNFGVSGKLTEYNMELLKEEVDICELLCSNCHRPKHAEEY